MHCEWIYGLWKGSNVAEVDVDRRKQTDGGYIVHGTHACVFIKMQFQFCAKEYFYLSPVNLSSFFHNIEIRLLSAAEGQSNPNQGCNG